MTGSALPIPSEVTVAPKNRENPSWWEEADVVCSRGCQVHMRPLRPSDRASLIEMFQRASDRAIRQRFFTSSRIAVVSYLDSVLGETQLNRSSVVALVNARMVGLAEYQLTGSDRAEIACFVAEDHHHSGVGELLISHLVRLARHHGIHTFDAETLPENTAALRALRHTGLPELEERHPGMIHIRLDLTTVKTAALVETPTPPHQDVHPQTHVGKPIVPR
ncbi:MAG TPA: GNAT family N-acetyltransferase [Nocardioidaceae bacterium]|nr:GNAT family N-acetyltransferase [Nocardioidaceae bacterium]